MRLRHYGTPAAFKQSLEQRLRDAAAEAGLELARFRQLLIFDRFLARATQVFGEALILKGGLVLELRLERARTTKDIDLRLVGNPSDTLSWLQAAGRLELGDYLRFTVQPDPRQPEIQAEGLKYQGLRYRAQADLAGKVYGAAFGIDVAFAEPLIRPPEVLTGRAFLEFAGIAPTRLRVYPLETHIAEKFHAYTLPRERPNSRVKDLPDLALLAMVRALDAETLRAVLQSVFEYRGTHALPTSVPEPPAAWVAPYGAMAQKDDLPWGTLAGITMAVRSFLNPALEGRKGSWSPSAWQWE
jgi:hypothetical protein